MINNPPLLLTSMGQCKNYTTSCPIIQHINNLQKICSVGQQYHNAVGRTMVTQSENMTKAQDCLIGYWEGKCW